VHDVAIRRMEASRVDAARTPAPLGALEPSALGGAEANVVVIDVTADAFLYGMMRNLASALVAVGTGRMTQAGFAAMIDRGRREMPLTTAPAHGLHQWRVTYAKSETPS
jgi:tRNA pseudouridine38-40 synthase